MNDTPPDGRAPGVQAYAWASRIMTVSLEMVLPGVGGFWLDRWLGSLPAFTVVGFAGGLILGMWHLIKMTSPKNGKTGGTNGPNKSSPDKTTSTPNDNDGPHSAT